MVPSRGRQFFQSKDFFLNSDKLGIITHLRTKYRKTVTHCKWICIKEQCFSCYKLYSFFIIKSEEDAHSYRIQTFSRDLHSETNIYVFSENCTGFTKSFRINDFCCGIVVFKRQAKAGIYVTIWTFLNLQWVLMLIQENKKLFLLVPKIFHTFDMHLSTTTQLI